MAKEGIETKIKNIMVGFAKAAPLIAGGLGGIFGSAPGTASPYIAIKDNRINELPEALLCNYTFYSATYGNFKSDRGIGIKSMAAGVVAHKLLGWIMDA